MRRAVGLAAAVAVLAAPSPAPAAQAPPTITMSGASPVQALVADLAFFYRRETPRAPRFAIVGGGTGTGIADAARGIVDAGMSGRTLAADDPPGLVFTPLALSAVCLVTNVANPVATLSRAQIQRSRRGTARGLAAGGRARGRSTRSPPWRSTSPPAPARCSCRVRRPRDAGRVRAAHVHRHRPGPRVPARHPGGLGLSGPGVHARPAHGRVRGHPVPRRASHIRRAARSGWSLAADHAALSPGSCAGSPATRRRSGSSGRATWSLPSSASPYTDHRPPERAWPDAKVCSHQHCASRVGARREAGPLPHRSVILAAVTALALVVACAEEVRADPLPSEQWAIAPGAVLNLPGAWQLSQGAGVIVAVIDSGVLLNNPDLAPNTGQPVRGRRQPQRRRRQRLRRRRPRRRPHPPGIEPGPA